MCFVSPGAVEPETTNALKRGSGVRRSGPAIVHTVDAPYWDDMGKRGKCREDRGASALPSISGYRQPLRPFLSQPCQPDGKLRSSSSGEQRPGVNGSVS